MGQIRVESVMSSLFRLNRFYDQVAPIYAGAVQFLPVWRRYMQAVLPWISPGASVLELGPGPGVLLAQISQCQPLATGLDRSRGMLRQARRRLVRAGQPIRLVQGDGTCLPFPSQSFDCVALTFTLSAVADGERAVQEMARVLRRADPSRGHAGGILALVDAGYPADRNWAGSALARLWESGGDRMRCEAALVEAAGLCVIHQKEFGAFNSIHLMVARRK